MLALGCFRACPGNPPVAESAPIGISARTARRRARCSSRWCCARSPPGCTALTGVEAVSNGVPNFKKPKSRNAAATLTIMGALTVAMFAGITALALVARVHVAADPSAAGRGPGRLHPAHRHRPDRRRGFGRRLDRLLRGAGLHRRDPGAGREHRLQRVPDPRLDPRSRTASCPRQFARRGDRLVFCNGIVILAGLAGRLIWAFDASTTRLIQLYIIGVFVSFTLSQAGMVRHWTERCCVSRRTAATGGDCGGPG